MIKGREIKGAPSTDLLVCFPTRAHLTLMPPKPICSPARPSEQNKRHHHNRHTRKKSISRLGSSGGGCQASPLLWAKNKPIGTEISEPTSPKVTCAGQIKVRHKAAGSCKSWQSVMEEIERIHNDRKNKKRSAWMEPMAFKKDILHFLTCLRNVRLDFRCFGAFPQSDITSDDDEEDEEAEEDHDAQVFKEANGAGESEGSRTVFSKWFMVLQENQSKGNCKEERKEVKERCFVGDQGEPLDAPPAVPPPNALLLMRCRSAPAKSWLEEKLEEEKEEELKAGGDKKGREKDEEKGKIDGVLKKGKNLKTLMEEEGVNDTKETLVVMRYPTGIYKISSDIAEETWIVGGMRDPLSRSRSWKR